MKFPKQSLHFWVFWAVLSVEVFPPAFNICLGAEITTAQWRMDLKCFARQMPLRHKNLYHTISEKQFEDEVADLYENLPGMSVAEAKVGFLRIVTSIGDAHTWISSMVDSPVLPIIHSQFGNDIYAVAAKQEYEAALGARLVAVGSRPIEEVVEILRPLAFQETSLNAKIDIPQWIHHEYALRGTGLWGNEDYISFQYEMDGRLFLMKVRSIPANELSRDLVMKPEPPQMYRSKGDNYWYRLLDNKNVIYIQYNSCANMPELPFSRFTQQIVNAARQNPVLKVIVDLRHNGGGNNQVMNPLLKALKRDPLKSARLYAITGCRTFSSGTWAACRLKSECMAVVVGEPSRQKLHAYGDTRTFTLPQSGLTVGYAVKFFDFVSEKDNLLIPDLPVPLKAEDYFAGCDAALERILAD